MKTSLLPVVFVMMAGIGSAVTVSNDAAIAADPVVAEESGGVTRISEVKPGQAVVLRGTVDRIRDEDEFILKDDSGKIEIYLGKLGRMPVKVGDTVTVHGRADDDVLPGFRPDIYASRLLRVDGTAVDVEHWD